MTGGHWWARPSAGTTPGDGAYLLAPFARGRMHCRREALQEGEESRIPRVPLPAVTPWPGKLQVYTSPTIIAKRSQNCLL